jgi:acyl-CoA reductase-like NAD-dependent aldehyde dehydrogenase
MNALFLHTIDGRGADSDRHFDVPNPSTEELFATCPDASKEQLDTAVAAARRAFAGWRILSYADRREALHQYAQGVRTIAEDIVRVLVSEQGKPLAEARDEVTRSAGLLEAMCTREPMAVALAEAPRRVELGYQPMGVVGAITPWNVPLLLAARKIAHALFAGNTMVLKPSPYTPLSTLMFGAASRDTLPAGVLNVVAGGNELGRWISEHPDINRIAFTGSVATGKKILVSAAATMKRVTLELGGNDPAIVLEDADLDEAAAGIFRGAFFNAGQICMAAKRLYAPASIYEPLVKKLTAIAERQKVGDGFEDGTTIGPLQNRMQFEKVMDLIDDTKLDPRARITTGGYRLNRKGNFIAPTIVADAEDDMRIVREEQFGPVLPVLRYDDLDDAVRRANETGFGLCGSVWSRDHDRAAAVARRIEAGTVWVNFHMGSLPFAPFGGFKQSGIGREFGEIGLLSYLEPQVLNRPA